MLFIYVFERRHSYIYDEEMFGFKYFIEQGFDIEVWSLVDWTFNNIPFPKNGCRNSNVHYISNYMELLDNLERVKNTNCYFLIYPYHAYNLISFKLRRSIKKAGFSFSNLTESPDLKYLKKNKSQVIYYELKKMIKLIVFFILGYILNQKGAKEICINLFVNKFGWLFYKSDYNFLTTSIMYNSFPNVYERYTKRNILLHSESYEEYLKVNQTEERIIQNDYIVFIDQFLTNHSDFIKHGEIPIIQNAEKYYDDLINLFNLIEEKYKCEIVIAAHPKAEYNDDEFCGRKIIYFKTDNLVKYAKLVIYQFSTTFGLISLFNKDYLNIYSEEMFNNLRIKDTYNNISRVCNSKALNICNKEEVLHWVDYVKTYSPKTFNYYNELMLISNGSESKFESMFATIARKIIEIKG